MSEPTTLITADGEEYSPLFGYVPDVEATEGYCDTLAFPRVADTPIMATLSTVQSQTEVYLWLALLSVLPHWARGKQGIGDCVSWGAELVITMLMAIESLLGKYEFEAEAATEAIYGGARVEANGGRLGGYSDGSYGAAAAKWLRDWGVILRKRYSELTGISEHDLEKYSASKAKEWGNYGCGGKDDAGREDGKLDSIARKFPVGDVSRVLHVDEADVALSNGKPITVASGVGYGSMRRNADGIVVADGSWAHQMMIGGLRRIKGLVSVGFAHKTAAPRRDFRQFQSWGPKSCSGPDPGIEHDAISGCSWWTREQDLQRQLNARDSFAFSAIQGFPQMEIPWAELLSQLDWSRRETAIA